MKLVPLLVILMALLVLGAVYVLTQPKPILLPVKYSVLV